ncbi:MAG TPA: IclR family transcriptional regulator [Candidatus Elarobacter sp.]|jgi:DNA-binding IclR family transcriptional regulator|nr:IclR family transcriptional regulator [Candidatus Elarobacter sp.]
MSQSLEKGLRLLQALGERADAEWHGLSLKDVASASSLDKATAHRLLRSLAKYGYVVQDERGRYAVGSAALALAHAAFESNRLVRRTLPLMRALHAETGETINLAERHELESVTIHELPSTQQVRYTTRIGAASPLHVGASSRATLAFSAPSVHDAVLGGPLARVTENSIADRDLLERMLERVRAEGYATSFGERVPGTNSVAVPLLAPDGVALGSLAILWPSRGDDVDRKRRATWPSLLLDHIKEIQRTL